MNKALIQQHRREWELIYKLRNNYDFTDEEQQCIREHVKQYMDEGIDQDQAVAKAIAKCAPEKAIKES